LTNAENLAAFTITKHRRERCQGAWFWVASVKALAKVVGMTSIPVEGIKVARGDDFAFYAALAKGNQLLFLTHYLVSSAGPVGARPSVRRWSMLRRRLGVCR
jgi:hypothetical protein